VIDYGLFALLVVILVLIFLAFHAWRGIQAESSRISAHRTDVDAKLTAILNEAAASRHESTEAKRIAMEVQGTHYKSLLHRIDEAEATALGATKQCEVLAEKCASLGGRLSALARWSKKEADPEPGDGEQQVPMFPAASMPSPGNMHVNGHFGRSPARKGG